MRPPQHLYKYRSLASDEDILRARDIIVNNRICFAAPSSFNDPFEGQVTISFGAPLNQKFNFLTNYALDHGLQGSQANNWATRVLENSIAEPEAHIHDDLRDAFRNRAGICTLSEINDDILMWAHYSDSHKGISIEFTPVTSVHLKWFENAVPVTYQKEFPAVQYYESCERPTEKDALTAMATKSNHWCYEKEWRLLRPKPGCYELPGGVISAVITGCAVSKEHTRLVHEWVALSRSMIDIYSTSITPGKYTLEIVSEFSSYQARK